jgi:hypothetical protein
MRPSLFCVRLVALTLDRLWAILSLSHWGRGMLRRAGVALEHEAFEITRVVGRS